MTARVNWDGVEAAYAAAETWVDRGLRNDDSLFTPGRAIWTRELLGELHRRFLDRPDEGNGSFLDKLEAQLEGSPPEVYQLMGEVLYVHYLLLDPNAPAVRRVLGWSQHPVDISPELVDGLQFLFINIGVARTLIPFHLGTLIETVEQWKELGANETGPSAERPLGLQEFPVLQALQQPTSRQQPEHRRVGRGICSFTSPSPTRSSGSSRMARTASPGSNGFAHFVDADTEDVDLKVQQIRDGLETELGRDFDFYDEDIKPLWQGNGPPPTPDPWDRFVRKAQAYVATGRLEVEEINYKLAIGERLAEAREAVLGDAADWADLVKRGIAGNLIHRISQAKFRGWIDGSPDDALAALKILWAREEMDHTERISRFCQLLPLEAVSGTGSPHVGHIRTPDGTGCRAVSAGPRAERLQSGLPTHRLP